MVPGFQELSDPDVFISGELHNVFVSWATTPVLLTALPPSFLRLAASFFVDSCVLEINVANSLRLRVHGFVLVDSEIVRVLYLVPGTTIITFSAEIFEINASPKVIPALKAVRYLYSSSFVSIVKLLMITKAITETFVARKRHAHVSGEHHLVMALNSFFGVLIQASFRITKRFQLYIVHFFREFTRFELSGQIFLSLIDRNIYTFPLVLLLVALNSLLRSPALQDNRTEVVIVEETLVLDVAPVAVVAGVFQAGATDGMRTTDGCGHCPGVLAAPVNVVNEDLFETFFAWAQVARAVARVFGVRHATFIPLAVRFGLAANFEAFAESGVEGLGAGCVSVRGVGTSHSCLSDDDEEVSQRHLVAVL